MTNPAVSKRHWVERKNGISGQGKFVESKLMRGSFFWNMVIESMICFKDSRILFGIVSSNL